MNIYFLEYDFEINDYITWKNNNEYIFGTIKDLLDDDIYLIQNEKKEYKL